MYKQLFIGAFFFLLLAVIGFNACIKEHCADVVCKNGGVCVNGACACPLGYEGAMCDKKWNEKFAGNWYTADSVYKDNIARYKYNVTITTGTTKDSFFVSGVTNTLRDSVVVCVRTSAYGFSMMGDKKLDSNRTVKSGSGIMDSVTGNVLGRYVLQDKKFKINDSTYKDSTVTVGFIWKK
jgi:hypothetical protein